MNLMKILATTAAAFAIAGVYAQTSPDPTTPKTPNAAADTRPADTSNSNSSSAGATTPRDVQTPDTSGMNKSTRMSNRRSSGTAATAANRDSSMMEERQARADRN